MGECQIDADTFVATKNKNFNIRKRARGRLVGALRQDCVRRRLATVRARLGGPMYFHQVYKGGAAARDLGCTIAEFKLHIEQQFLPGMTWENWTLNGWHLDHKIPLAAFDLTKREQFLAAWHFSNFQPLWARNNLSKGARWVSDF